MSQSPIRPIRRVFHPTDFSQDGHIAFLHALKIAVANRANFDLLHVAPSRAGEAQWDQFPRVRETLAAWGLLDASARTKDVASLGLGVRKIDARHRSPLAAINGYLDEEAADLVVLASEGRVGLQRWTKPSVSEPVARHARGASLFVPHGVTGFVSAARGEVRLRRVLIPVDRKPAPGPAIATAVSLVKGLGCQDTRFEAFHAGDGFAADDLATPPDGELSFVATAAGGSPADDILERAGAQETDLIVMATEGHHGVLDALRGSTTEQVLHRAPCPILAVPAQ